ncbi:MAG: hypothetical protein ACPHCN_17930 [Mycobacterium sp.]
MAETDPRPRLPILQARSTWLAIGSVLAAIFMLAGDAETAEAVKADFADKMLAAVSSALALWAYVERLFGKMRLVF